MSQLGHSRHFERTRGMSAVPLIATKNLLDAASAKGREVTHRLHACGYALANKGHDTRALQAYLGHKNIQHTVRYTELSPKRFKDFWRD